MNVIQPTDNFNQCSLAIIVCKEDPKIGEALIESAKDQLSQYEIQEHQITVVWVDTTHHYPLIAQRLAKSGSTNGVLCLDAREDVHQPFRRAQIETIRRSCQEVSLQYEVPVIFSIPKKQQQVQVDTDSAIKTFSRQSIDQIISIISLLQQI